MPKKPFSIPSFKGMSNVEQTTQDLSEPHVILDAITKETGVIHAREGYAKIQSLTNAHSLWSNGKFFLFVSAGTLYVSFDGVSKYSLGSVYGPVEPLSYAQVGNSIYISNKYWTSVYDIKTNTIRSWGITPPPAPILSSSSNGSLVPGIYSVCLTIEDSAKRMSGSSGISQIELTAVGGISISNFPVGGIAWITDAYGSTFYFATKLSTIVEAPGLVKLPSLFCAPAPNLSNLCLHGGRVWGSVGELLYYSQPFGYEWFNLFSSYFVFNTDILMVARTSYGLFIGFEDQVIFMTGTDPAKMKPTKVGDGVVKGSLCYADRIPDLGDNVPVWMTRSGFVAADRPVRAYGEGRTLALAQTKIKFDVGSQAASLFRLVDGGPQILTSFQGGSTVGLGDQVTVEVIRMGRVFTDEWEREQTDSIALQELVTAELNP